MHHYDPSERLIEIAVAAKRFWDVAGGDVYGTTNGSIIIGSPHGEPVLQMRSFDWEATLLQAAHDGAEYRLSSGNRPDGGRWTHLYVQVMGARFWAPITPGQAAELVDRQNKEAPAVAAAEA